MNNNREHGPRFNPSNSEGKNHYSHNAEVLYGLTDKEGNHIGEALVERIYANPGIQRVIILGEAGSNKSTIGGQLVTELQRRTNGAIIATIFTFDDEFAQIERFVPRSEWQQEQWQEFNERFFHSMISPDPNISRIVRGAPAPFFEQPMTFIETVSIGGTRFDRAVSALQRFVQHQQEQDRDHETLYIALVPAYRTQMQAAYTRTFVLGLQNPQEVERFLNNENIVIDGFPLEMSHEERGLRIQYAFSRMANSGNILRQSREVLLMAEALVQQNPQLQQELQPFLTQNNLVFPYFSLESKPDISIETQEAFEYLLKTMYLEDHVRNVLRLPEEQTYIVRSPYRTDTIHYPASIFMGPLDEELL